MPRPQCGVILLCYLTLIRGRFDTAVGRAKTITLMLLKLTTMLLLSAQLNSCWKKKTCNLQMIKPIKLHITHIQKITVARHKLWNFK